MRLAICVCQFIGCVPMRACYSLCLALPPPDLRTRTHRSCFRSKRRKYYKGRQMPDKHAGAVEHKAAEKATKEDPHELQGGVCVTKVRTDGT